MALFDDDTFDDDDDDEEDEQSFSSKFGELRFGDAFRLDRNK
jgi:hypothetical protein